MISAGEASGEMYGAMLSRELKARWQDIQIFGIGGSRMKAEGVVLIAPTTHVLGIAEVFYHILEIGKTFRKAKEALLTHRPDVLVLIDYPDFNIALARSAKAIGIPILYYVSPQIWAWRSGRVKKIASLVNRMAVLFPFEVEYYRKAGLQCEFVGHPVAENIEIRKTREQIKADLGLDPRNDVITLLPGSRPKEISRHQSVIKEIAEKVHAAFPEIQIVIPLASGTNLTVMMPEHVKIIFDRTVESIACSEASAVASGTATLETALIGVPMVVFYKISPLTYFIGKQLTKLRYIALVNILSGKEVVVELLQKDANADKIFAEIRRILVDKAYRDTIISNLNKIRDTLKDKKPSARVATLIGEIAGWKDAVNL